MTEKDLVARLRDPAYAGAFQHLRSYSEIDRLFNEAADYIAALEKEDARKEVELDAISSNLLRAEEISATLRAQLSEARKANQALHRRCQLAERVEQSVISQLADWWEYTTKHSNRNRPARRLFKVALDDIRRRAVALRRKGGDDASA